jgi:hypothetical protein
MLRITAGRLSRSSGGVLLKWFTLISSALIGPFPNFNQTADFGIIHNGGLLFKVLFSLPLLAGIGYIIKNFKYRSYALLVYCSIGMLMLVLSGVSLDMRYQITFFPLMLPFAAYAVQRKLNSILYYCYIALSLGLIVVYNNR